MEAITSPHPIITGVPIFKLVSFDALLVTYPPNSLDFFISGNSLKYLVLKLKILKIFFDNFLFFISPGYTETSVSSLFIFPVNLNLNQSLQVKIYLIFFKHLTHAHGKRYKIGADDIWTERRHLNRKHII